MPVPVVIALGSNLGNRALQLRRAIDELRRTISLVRVSAIFETAAAGMPAGSPPFLNMVAAGHTALPAEDLLDALHAIEARLGRRRSTRNASRTIDLDLILYDEFVMTTTDLALPDPGIPKRPFLAIPLHELAPGLILPGSGLHIKEVAASLTPNTMEPLETYTEHLRKEYLHERKQ